MNESTLLFISVEVMISVKHASFNKLNIWPDIEVGIKDKRQIMSWSNDFISQNLYIVVNENLINLLIEEKNGIHWLRQLESLSNVALDTVYPGGSCAIRSICFLLTSLLCFLGVSFIFKQAALNDSEDGRQLP